MPSSANGTTTAKTRARLAPGIRAEASASQGEKLVPLPTAARVKIAATAPVATASTGAEHLRAAQTRVHNTEIECRPRAWSDG
jgi:hypothetical protein